jgi:hypothetical protein
LSKHALRFIVPAACAIVCLASPITICWLGYTYGFDRLRTDADYQSWRGDLVDAMFWIAIVSTSGLIVSMRRWWWLAALVSLPLLCVTAILALTCRMWIDGNYL